MQHQRDHVGNNSPVKVDQGHIAEDLLRDARFGISRKLENEGTRLQLSLEKHSIRPSGSCLGLTTSA